MKKKYQKFITALLAVTTIFMTGCARNNAGNADTRTAALLTETDARQIALQKAGLETATFTKQEYDSYETEYEFEFYAGDKEYDCNVSALDGAITEYDVDLIHDAAATNTSS